MFLFVVKILKYVLKQETINNCCLSFFLISAKNSKKLRNYFCGLTESFLRNKKCCPQKLWFFFPQVIQTFQGKPDLYYPLKLRERNMHHDLSFKINIHHCAYFYKLFKSEFQKSGYAPLNINRALQISMTLVVHICKNF